VREALDSATNYIGTEHLLLGLMCEDNVGSKVLTRPRFSRPRRNTGCLAELEEIIGKRSTRAKFTAC